MHAEWYEKERKKESDCKSGGSMYLQEEDDDR